MELQTLQFYTSSADRCSVVQKSLTHAKLDLSSHVNFSTFVAPKHHINTRGLKSGRSISSCPSPCSYQRSPSIPRCWRAMSQETPCLSPCRVVCSVVCQHHPAVCMVMYQP